MSILEKVVEEAVRDLRQRLADANSGSNFSLTINASGRVVGGDVKISYSLGDAFSSGDPRGNRLAPVVDEYLRRKGWAKANEPLAIGFDASVIAPAPASAAADDLPF